MYNQELNDKLDATIEGSKIKKTFNRVERELTILINLCESTTDENGEFDNPILNSFSADDKIEMLAYINAILDLSKPFIETFSLINKK